MKSLLLFWLIWLNTEPQKKTFCIKGQVVLKSDQEGMPGVKISFSGAASPIHTTADGSFLLQVNRKSSYSLQLEFPTMASVQLVHDQFNF